MKHLVILFASLCLVIHVSSQSQYREEFNGPFKSWANVKTRFGAAGDGIKDDTKALQLALDSLSTLERALFNNNGPTKYTVVYLPAGTYKISQTLRLSGKIGVTFIGEDPQKTIIKWYGSDNDTMFFSNRSAYLKISRLTWDANDKKNMEGLGLHYKDFSEPNFAPTSIEFSDMIFKGNLKNGISAGTYTNDGTGMMDAEVTIRRCKFYSCGTAGILIKGFNALDYWIWDCEFNNCYSGVDCSHGNYHIYKSHFNNSQLSDISVKDALYSSVRWCYSTNSKAFSIDAGAGCGAFKRIFQGNVVQGCKSVPIQFHHQGKISLMDNYFLNESKVPYTVDYTSWCKGNFDILSINNNYKEANPNNLRKDFPSTVHSIADTRASMLNKSIPANPPMEPFAPYVKRKVFDIPNNANAAVIQKIINTAAALKGQRCIVHFPMGNYKIDETLVVPAESDIQIIGDGILYASTVKKSNNNDGAFSFFKINGPSYITIKDLQLAMDKTTDKSVGFNFTNVDQPGSMVKLDQINCSATSSIYIDHLDYTYFEKNNSFFSTGNTIIGGEKVKNGTGTSRLYCFGGQSVGVRLENNATMVAKDCWWEGALNKQFLPFELNGSGNLTIDGANFAPSIADSGALFNVSPTFKGKVTLLNMHLAGSINANSITQDLKMLIWNVNFHYKQDPFMFLRQKLNCKVAMMGITTQCQEWAGVKCSTGDPQSLPDMVKNITDLPGFIKDLVSENRKAIPKPFVNLKPGVSNVYISRVSVSNVTNAYFFHS